MGCFTNISVSVLLSLVGSICNSVNLTRK